jgi:hypothetical protein
MPPTLTSSRHHQYPKRELYAITGPDTRLIRLQSVLLFNRPILVTRGAARCHFVSVLSAVLPS